MDATENKRILWDLTKHMYKSWMPRERVIRAFEETIREVDAANAPLLEKNKLFLKVYLERVAAMQPETEQERVHMFEERQKQYGDPKQEKPTELQDPKPPDLNVIHVPSPKKVAFEDTRILEELADIRKMLEILLERSRSRL